LMRLISRREADAEWTSHACLALWNRHGLGASYAPRALVPAEALGQSLSERLWWNVHGAREVGKRLLGQDVSSWLRIQPAATTTPTQWIAASRWVLEQLGKGDTVEANPSSSNPWLRVRTDDPKLGAAIVRRMMADGVAVSYENDTRS
jgi:hypothetical protein